MSSILKTFLLLFLSLSFLSTDSVASANENPYALDAELEARLKLSSVIITCGDAHGTGVAIGDRHILTAAHNIGGYTLAEKKVHCYGVSDPKDMHLPSAVKSYVDESKRQCYEADFSTCDSLREIDILQVSLPEDTIIKEHDETPTGYTLDGIKAKLEESMLYGLKSAEKYTSYGVGGNYYDRENGINVTFRVFGPDVALLECAAPHGLPAIELSAPLVEEKSVLHMLGFAGHRFKGMGLQPWAGVACPSDIGPLFLFASSVYSQSFTCLTAYPDTDLKTWMNRVPLKKIKGEFFMHDSIYPEAPEGFGLIAPGDSGAGSVVIRDGKPYLVGLVSSSGIEEIFTAINGAAAQHPVLQGYLTTALEATEEDEKWFNTQGLADTTHLKKWVEYKITVEADDGEEDTPE